MVVITVCLLSRNIHAHAHTEFSCVATFPKDQTCYIQKTRHKVNKCDYTAINPPTLSSSHSAKKDVGIMKTQKQRFMARLGLS